MSKRRLFLLLPALLWPAPALAAQGDVPDLPRSSRDRGRLTLPDTPKNAAAAPDKEQRQAEAEAAAPRKDFWGKPANRYEEVFAQFEQIAKPSEVQFRKALEELRAMGLGSRKTALKALDSPRPATVELAASLLEDVGEPEDAEVLVEVASGVGVTEVAVACLETALRLRGGWLPARAVRLLEHPKNSARAAVEARLSRLPHEEHVTPLLQLVRFGRDPDSRLRAARLLGDLAAHPDVRAALRAALVDPAVPVAAAAAESLVGTGRPEEVAFLQEEILTTAAGPELGFLLWALLLQQEELGTLLVTEAMEEKLVSALGEPDIFLSGAAAACLAEFGFRSERDEGFEYLDREVPHALVRAVGGVRFYPQYARLMPLAEKSLKRITGVDIGTEKPSAWLEWLVENLDGFRALRGALTVEPGDYARLQVGWHTGEGAWQWMGGPENTMPQAASRLLGKHALEELVRVLEAARVLDVRMLPGTFGPASAPLVGGVEVQVGMRRKRMEFRGESGQDWLPELLGQLAVLHADTSWQVLAPPAERRAFTLARLPRWDSASPEERLAIIAQLSRERAAGLAGEPLVLWSAYLGRQPGLAQYWDETTARGFLELLAKQGDDEQAARAALLPALLRPEQALTAPFLAAASALEEPARSGILYSGLEILGLEVCSFCLRDDRVPVRVAAARALAAFDAAALPSLATALADGNLLVQRMAARSLGSIRDPKALPLLLPKAGPAEKTEVRKEALWSLGVIGHAGALEVVVLGAGDPDPGVRIAAIMALGQLPGAAADRAFQALFPKYAGTSLESPYMRALDKRGAATARRVMRPYLEAEDPLIVRQAALELGALGDPAAAPVLVGLLAQRPRDQEVLASLAFTTCFDFRLMEDPAGIYTEWWRERGQDKPTLWLASSLHNLRLPVPESLIDAPLANRKRVVGELLEILKRAPPFLRPAITYHLNQLTGVDAPALRARSSESAAREAAAAWQGWLNALSQG